MIEYASENEFTQEETADLFLALNWESGKVPEKLVRALRNYPTVITAREDGKLVGLIAALDDGVMTAYIHYLLVRPECRGKGIGRELVRLLKEKYKDYLRIVLLAYREAETFYERCGFCVHDEEVAMELNRFAEAISD